MSTRVEDKDGNGYVFMTPQEAQAQGSELLTFESRAHAQAFFDHLDLTPEALEQLYRRVMDELAQQADPGPEGNRDE
jgi:hypothetical protein